MITHAAGSSGRFQPPPDGEAARGDAARIAAGSPLLFASASVRGLLGGMDRGAGRFEAAGEEARLGGIRGSGETGVD